MDTGPARMLPRFVRVRNDVFFSYECDFYECVRGVYVQCSCMYFLRVSIRIC